MIVIKYRNFFIALSTLFVAVSLALLVVFPIKLGIEFTGGSALTLSYPTRPAIADIQAHLASSGFAHASVTSVGDREVLIKTATLSDSERASLISAASFTNAPATQSSFTAIGPSIGAELKQKAILSVIIVLLAIVCFVAYAFRRVSKPVSSWKYGLAVIIALVHDLAIPLGAFALIGHVTGAEADPLLVVALLTTLALSIADTIVVFDRVRETLAGHRAMPFDEVVGMSLSQTFVRSLNTSLVVLVMVVTLAVLGPRSTKLFAEVLAIGMFFGTYSSIFLASPLLVMMGKNQK